MNRAERGSRGDSSRRVIGIGRTAEILAWGEDRAMKLYREGSPRGYVQREAFVSRFVHRAGLPAPAVFDADTDDGLHELDGRLGILYERVDGPTMLRDVGNRPWMVVSHAKTLAALHAGVHSASGDGLPTLRVRLERAIDEAAEWLTGDERAAAAAALDRLPDGRQVCHGDFHPDNVLLGANGPTIVDWGPAFAGDPAADVAWTILLFRRAGSPIGTSPRLRVIVTLIRRIVLRVYLRTYSRLSGIPREEIEAWLGIIAILRLTDRIPEERESLLRLIRRRFGRGG